MLVVAHLFGLTFILDRVKHHSVGPEGVLIERHVCREGMA